jgi:methoxymalonate biosynthesis acyl carrier protein
MSISTKTSEMSREDSEPDVIEAVVRRFLARYVDDVTLLDSGGLITRGLLDSLAAVELIAALEHRFAISISDDDLEIDNFDSIAGVVAFVTGKQAG